MKAQYTHPGRNSERDLEQEKADPLDGERRKVAGYSMR
jgi:hypothetical protein